MTLSIQPELFDRLFIHNQPFSALKEAIMYGMRADPLAVLTVTETQLIQIPLIPFVIVVFDYLRVHLIMIQVISTSTKASKVY